MVLRIFALEGSPGFTGELIIGEEDLALGV